MNRATLIDRYARARKAHAPRQHIFEDLKWATIEELKAECRSYWPASIIAVSAAAGFAILCIAVVAGGTIK